MHSKGCVGKTNLHSANFIGVVPETELNAFDAICTIVKTRLDSGELTGDEIDGTDINSKDIPVAPFKEIQTDAIDILINSCKLERFEDG